MTTLPQTTPLRLPRASGPSSLVVPSAPAAGGGGPAFQMSAGDVWRVIRSNLWLIVLLVGASAAGGYFLNDYLAKHYSAYSSSGLIRIRPIQPLDPLRGTPMYDGGVEMAQATQTQLIKNDGLIDQVLKDPDNPIRQTGWFRLECGGDPQRAHEMLAKYLSVEPQPSPELIKVAVTTSNKADAPVLVTAVCEQAILNEMEDNRNKNNAKHKELADLKDRNAAALRAASRDVRELGDEINHDGGNAGGGSGPKDLELSRELEQNIALNRDQIRAENDYGTLKAGLAGGEVPGEIQAMVDADRDVTQLQSNVDDLDVKIRLDERGPSSPQVQQLQTARSVFQNQLDNKRAEKAAQFSRTMLARLETEKATDSQLLDASNKQVNDLKQSIADLQTKDQTYLARREDQSGYRKLDDEYRERLDQLDAKVQMADFGSLAWAQRPLEPSVPSFPKLTSTMGGCVLVGLTLSLGIAFLRELTDTTVRSPRDVIRVGQMTMLGMVPHEADDPQSTGVRLPLVIFEAPTSVMAEQLRQVRTRLQHAASLDTTRSILVTSAAPGDGKSTIAVNLAAGLALNGRRILLVDANFRRPELHRIFGIGNEVGFSDVLNDVNAFASAVRETTVPNLSVMPSGPRPANSTELLESQLLIDAVERALEEYDHVIFDSGPMLIVSESVALAPRVDGVVTVVRARSSSRGVLLRMRDVLRQVKAEHLGVVLNGVRTQAGGYYGRSIKTYYEYQNPA